MAGKFNSGPDFGRLLLCGSLISIGNHTVSSQFNLELICTSEFFKKLKLREPLRRVQFQRFEKLTSAN